MERRHFLGTLFATLGAFTVDPTLLWSPATVPRLPPLQPRALVGLQGITNTLSLDLLDLWHPSRLTAASLIGADRMRHQLQVMMAVPADLDEHGLDHEQFIHPAARALAQKLDQYHATHCGTLAIPIGATQSTIVTRSDANLSVRGILQYLPQDDRYGLRFDVLCG